MIYGSLKKEMRKALTMKRFSHVLAVVSEVERLCKIFEISNVSNLTASALLHDCTKPLSYEEHIAYAEKYGFVLSEDDLKSPEVLHARTGALKAEREYGVNGDAIFCHTTGKADMTVPEKILFLADYIEKTRTHEICIETRRAFYSELESAKTLEDKLKILDKTVLTVLENTVRHLETKKAFIHKDTYLAIDFLKEASNETR